jgi:DNA processing protein
MEDATFTADGAGCEAALLELIVTLGHCTQRVGELLRSGIAAQQLLDAEPALLAALPRAVVRRLFDVKARPAHAVEELLRQLRDCRAGLLPITDPRYPACLREIPDPPPWLFCRGRIDSLGQPAVALVGSRRASHAGLTIAARLAETLAAGGYQVCSGLALGIDAAAHRGALRGGSTVAVLGTGIDHCYPPGHAALAEEIAARGCVISELPPATAPHRGQFPRRNRIISGLSQATVVVEAALPSGSLHTAAAALEQGREVFTLPWSVLHRGGAGCLYLLRDGATPLTSLDELDEHFPLLAARLRTDAREEQLLTLIGDSCLSLQALQSRTGTPTGELRGLLASLELSGRILRCDGGYLRAADAE